MDDGEMLKQGEKRLRATTIFEWRCTRAARTDRIGLRRIERQNLLKADLMSPEIAEVIFVGKTLVRAEVKTGETHLLGIIREGDPADVGNTVGFAVDDEAVDVRVGPAKSALDDLVEIGDPGVAANQDAAPDQWADRTEAN